jgi:hypothetical protein
MAADKTKCPALGSARLDRSAERRDFVEYGDNASMLSNQCISAAWEYASIQVRKRPARALEATHSRFQDKESPNDYAN